MLDQWHILNSTSPGGRTLWLVGSMGTCSLLGIGNEQLCVQGLLDGFCGDERDPQMMLGIEPGSVSCKPLPPTHLYNLALFLLTEVASLTPSTLWEL